MKTNTDSKPSSNGKLTHSTSPLPGGKKERIVSNKKKTTLPGLATDPELIQTIRSDIESLGVVGESDLALLIYLAGSSRLLEKPLRLIVRGKSGSGKSFPLAIVSRMFPPESVLLATSITPQALYYGQEGWLQNKFIVKGERSRRNDDETADATAAIRQLISENRISKVVTVKGEAVTIEQKGPIAFCETTTSDSIFNEDLNRCLQVFADDSEEQTRRIVDAAASEYEVGNGVDSESIISRHQEFQSSLQPVTVTIPFARNLARLIPQDKVESRRAIQQVFATIEAIAFIHQYQRDKDDHGRLEATLGDYAVAQKLLLGPIDEALGVGRLAYDSFYLLRSKFPNQFTTTQAIQGEVFNQKVTANKVLKRLESMGVLRCEVKGRGPKPTLWRWTGIELEPVLPRAKTLSAKSVNRKQRVKK